MKPPKPESIGSVRELEELQRRMADAIMRPLNDDYEMQAAWSDGRPMDEVAAEFIKPNERLTSFERLAIYNRQYWFRIIDCFYDDFPGLRAVLGERKFAKLSRAYLARYPSQSFTLRNLGSRLEKFLNEEPQWFSPHEKLAHDMVRFEWAQVIAFDGEARPALVPDDLLGCDPGVLHLKLQPYLTLLELNHPVDDFSLALKKPEGSGNTASNAVSRTSGQAATRPNKIRKPKRERVYLAVHRYDNALYYKRLDPEAYRILVALREGSTLAEACETADESAAERIGSWFKNWAELGWFWRE